MTAGSGVLGNEHRGSDCCVVVISGAGGIGGGNVDGVDGSVGDFLGSWYLRGVAESIFLGNAWPLLISEGGDWGFSLFPRDSAAC